MMRYGKIITNTRPSNVEIYLDGVPVPDSDSDQIAKTPKIILNVSEGIHNVTFIKPGFDYTTVMVYVQEGLDTYARAVLSTKFMRYPMMLSSKEHQNTYIKSYRLSQPLSQPSPGWPALPIPQIPYGHLVVNTIPDEAEIYIDEKPVFDTVGKVLTTPASVLGIVVGRHTVTFKKKGYFDSIIEVDVYNGLYSDASSVLRPINIVSKPVTIIEPVKGEIMIDTSPGGAKIYIDETLMTDKTGNPIRTPITLTLNEGWHDMVLFLENHCREFGPIYIYPDVRTHIHKNLYRPPCE